MFEWKNRCNENNENIAYMVYIQTNTYIFCDSNKNRKNIEKNKVLEKEINT